MVAVALFGILCLAALVAAMLLIRAHAYPMTGAALPVPRWAAGALGRCGEAATSLVQPLRAQVAAEYRRSLAQAQGRRQFWNNIQLLRLLAAFAIVYVHLELVFDAVHAGAEVVEVLRFGTDLFLVVAGFLSAHVLGKSGKPAAVYLRDRAIRILPLYVIFTVLAFLAKNSTSGFGAVTGRELAMSLAFIPYGPYPILHPTWTLVVIVEFSLIIAAFQLLSVRNGALYAALFVVAITLLGQLFPPDSPALAAYSNPILIDFALGVVVYKLVAGTSWNNANVRAATASAVTVLAISAAAVLLRPFLWPALPRLIGLGLPATGLLLGAVVLERAGWSFGWLPGNFVAKCTYSIYLCHQFVNGASEKLLAHANGSSVVPICILVATPMVVTMMAVVIFACVEAPITRHLSGSSA